MPPSIRVERPFRDEFASPQSAGYQYEVLGYRIRWIDDEGRISEIGKRLRLVAGGLCTITTDLDLGSIPEWRKTQSYFLDASGRRIYLAKGIGIAATYETPVYTVQSFAAMPWGFQPREFLIVPGSIPGLTWEVEPPRRCFLGAIPQPIAMAMLLAAQS